MANSSFFDFHCPTGGDWYACANGSNFVGCCTTDPCTNGCVQGNIRAGGYNISHHGEWPDASCGSASDFFTCNAGDSFWGCCKSNPCAATPPATCAQGDLVPAFMERPEQFNVYASASASPTPAPSSGSNIGAIAGGVVGGLVVVAIIGAIIFFVLRKRRNQKPAGGEMGAAAMVPMMNGEKRDHSDVSVQYGGQSPPPTYSAPQDAYQTMSPSKGHPSYQQYAHNAIEPQELPADTASPAEHRYSELPANFSGVVNTRRFSELPPGARAERVSELESPEISPRPLQTEFLNDMAKRASPAQGLGLTTEEGPRKN
ncbi:hypothetical protein BDW02DRAFT_573300 [Decorospora gaudefroyi]|uniref:receptor protein-tyrosine kinase n=1 Tax=Decorospora gaudefroyi TaxID=184978 RepID=A0A6A5JZZ4_9PLEO|nr:hypothetical protein BDW02DRAFT_573300 [Decorospora gaudefroyi]